MASPAREATGKKQQKKPATVTQVIAAAADVVIARPLLMLAPVLLDLYYVLGWRLVPGATFERLQQWLLGQDTSAGDWLAKYVDRAASIDIAGGIAFAIPSLMPDATGSIYRPVDRTAVFLDNWGAVALVALVVLGLTLFLFGFFGLWLADSGLKRDRSWGDRARLGPVIGGRFAVLTILFLAMLLLLLAPFLVAMAVASRADIELGSLVLSAGVLAFLALYVLFYFAPDSLLVDLAGPVQALRASSAVVRGNLSVTLLFVIVSIFLSIGLADLWDRIAADPPGLAIAIVANAFIGCVLWIASLLFFSERSQMLALERAAAIASPSIT